MLAANMAAHLVSCELERHYAPPIKALVPPPLPASSQGVRCCRLTPPVTWSDGHDSQAALFRLQPANRAPGCQWATGDARDARATPAATASSRKRSSLRN